MFNQNMLSDKPVIVTGGNGGIGFGIAQAVCGVGGKVLIVGRSENKTSDAVQRLGENAYGFCQDLRSPEAANAVVEHAFKKFGDIYGLVNNAGISIRKRPEDFTLDDWHQVIDTNLSAAFFCSQVVYPHFKKRGAGKIVNIGSLQSIFGFPLAAPYSASKGGILQLTKALATSWSSENIQVNCILPGWIDTDITRGARQSIPTLNDDVLKRTPAKRWGQPSDIASAALFLLGSGSEFISGAGLSVDGGYAAMC